MELHNILESLCTVEGVTGALLVDESGGHTGSIKDKSVDAEQVVTLARNCIYSGSRIADALMKPPLKQSYVELDDSSITMDLLENGSILVLLSSKGANLGRIRLEIRKTRKNIESLTG